MISMEIISVKSFYRIAPLTSDLRYSNSYLHSSMRLCLTSEVLMPFKNLLIWWLFRWKFSPWFCSCKTKLLNLPLILRELTSFKSHSKSLMRNLLNHFLMKFVMICLLALLINMAYVWWRKLFKEPKLLKIRWNCIQKLKKLFLS